jgi:hypothetical protein
MQVNFGLITSYYGSLVQALMTSHNRWIRDNHNALKQDMIYAFMFTTPMVYYKTLNYTFKDFAIRPHFTQVNWFMPPGYPAEKDGCPFFFTPYDTLGIIYTGVDPTGEKLALVINAMNSLMRGRKGYERKINDDTCTGAPIENPQTLTSRDDYLLDDKKFSGCDTYFDDHRFEVNIGIQLKESVQARKCLKMLLGSYPKTQDQDGSGITSARVRPLEVLEAFQNEADRIYG